MKLILETGSERHSTSLASVQAKYANGPQAGKYLYQVSGAGAKRIGSTPATERY